MGLTLPCITEGRFYRAWFPSMGPCEPKKVPTEPGIPPPDLSRTVELQMVLQRSKLLQVDTGTEVERAIKGERERERERRGKQIVEQWRSHAQEERGLHVQTPALFQEIREIFAIALSSSLKRLLGLVQKIMSKKSEIGPII